MNKPQKKYGFITASALVVGIVIGSGVFKSAGSVLAAAGGKLSTAILAWIIGGLIMIVSSYAFSLVAVRVEKNSGIVDYVEEAAGEKIGYLVAWFMNFVYYPTLIGILAWLGGSITSSLFSFSSESATWLLASVYLLSTYLLSFISPILAGKWQVSATIIKLIPLVLIAVVGLFYGFINGTTIDNFTHVASNSQVGSLAKAVAITAFAYEGWIIATTINSELINAKKNLPKALLVGSILVTLLYLLFFVGLSGVLSNNRVIELSGSLDTTVEAAKILFGQLFGNAVVVLVLVSVLGTLNGLVMGGVRGMYAISVRNKGPKPEVFVKLSNNDATINSGIISMIATLFWGIVWFGNFKGWWGNNFMDTSVLPIVFLYAIYIIVYSLIIRKLNDLNIFNRFIVPVLSTLGALYLVYGAFVSDEKMFLYFALLVLFIILIGFLTYDKKYVNKKAN
jgi:APA family basic amino acid/polyamine antiporter